MNYSERSKEQLRKACESALLAVEIYNKPSIKFKSGGYVVLMVIAWTALFHAIFYKKRVKPFHKRKGRFVLLSNGDVKLWEVEHCAREYYGSESDSPVEKNIKFFVPLRNEFEHRSYPALDATIFGECQSLLLNFDELLGAEFGQDARIRESLSFSLQLFPSSEPLSEAVRKNADVSRLAKFINDYRTSISAEIWNSGKFSFKAFLIQVSNHETTDSLPVQFVDYDKMTSEERAEIEKVIKLTREKVVEVRVVNAGMLKPGAVVKRVNTKLSNCSKREVRTKRESPAFNSHTHTLCYNEYKVRPKSDSSEKSKTMTRYCLYDEANNSYLYTTEWVEYLVGKLSDTGEFERILNAGLSEKRWEIVNASSYSENVNM